MNHLNETHAILVVLPPQDAAKATAVTSTYADMQCRDRFCFAVSLGAVAEGKSVKAELLSSGASTGSDAKVEGEITFTAPTGGVTSHMVQISGRVTALRGRYLAVRVTNVDTETAIKTSAVLIADHAYYPEDTGSTTLVV